MQATLTFLGSGTSMGVPTLGCECAVCRSAVAPSGSAGADSRNRRTRPSIRIEYKSVPGQADVLRADENAGENQDHNRDQALHTVLVDTGPDFHAQALREHIRRIDAVFYTHPHADHTLGMDDLRPLSFRNPTGIPLYADEPTAAALRRVFAYTFSTDSETKYPTSARVTLHPLPPAGQAVTLFGADFQRIPVIHGRDTIVGYRFGSAAYLTDLSDLPPEAYPMLEGLDILIIDALRRDPHPSHSHLAKSVAFVQRIQPRRAFFTHISHDLDQSLTDAGLPPNVSLAYDGLQLTFDIAPTAPKPPEPMQVFRSLAGIPADFGPVVATAGNFDGVHRGHRWVIEKVKARAHALGLKSLAITFDPHPVSVLRPEAPHVLITPLDRKLELLATTGIDATLVLPFDSALAALTPEQFARQVLAEGAHIREIHEGENFRFGANAGAGIAELQSLGAQLGFTAHACQPLLFRRSAVSSSRIRALIAAGNVSAAHALLGTAAQARPFAIRSTPAAGRGYGTRYTVPTINLAPYPELLPANGVYITTLSIGKGSASEIFEAVTNVGNRPTFGADSFTVESHILNFHPVALAEDTPLELTFLKRLRDEVRFASPEALREQITRDVARAKRYFSLCKARGAASIT